MKKAFDQTVRDLKREVNKKVLKVSIIEQKTLDATSNEPWGPQGSVLAEIAQATYNYHDYKMIMAALWKRLQDTGKNWRHVYKALSLLEYLVVHGSERVIDDTREHAYQISALSEFLYTDSNGRDQGSNVRRRSQSLVALVNNKEKVQEARQKALSKRDKNHNSQSAGASRPPLSSSVRYDDEPSKGHDGNRDEGYMREKDGDTYRRGRYKYTQEGDQYCKDIDVQYSRDDSYRVCGNGDYQYRTRSQSVDGYSDRSYDDDRCSTQSIEHRLSADSIDVPPSYEEATGGSCTDVQDDKDNGIVTASLPNASSPSTPKETSSKVTNQAIDHNLAGEPVPTHDKQVDCFEDFDPRGSVSAALPASTSGLEFDIFGFSAGGSANIPAPLLMTSTTTSEVHILPNSGTNFEPTTTCSNEPDENPFGDAPFKAIPQEDFPSHVQKSASVTSSQASSGFDSGADIYLSADTKMEAVQCYDFGDILGGLSYAPRVANGQHSRANLEFYASEIPAAHSSDDILDGILPRTGHMVSVSSEEATSQFFPEPGFSGYAASHAHQNPLQAGSVDMQIGQINPFEQPELSNHLASQEDSFACPAFQPTAESQAIQMNSLEQFGFSEPQMQGAPVFPHAVQLRNPNLIQAYASEQPGIPTPPLAQIASVSIQASQSASPNKIQAVQMNYKDKQQLSSPQTSQGTSLLVGESAVQASRGTQWNQLQQPGLSAPLPSQTTPVSSHAFPPASTNVMQIDQMNSLNQAVLSSPQVSQMYSGLFQTVQATVPANLHGAQKNPLQQASLSTSLAEAVPVSSQAFHSEVSQSLPSAQRNPLQQPLMSAPQSSLGVPVSSHAFQSVAPANMQGFQVNPSLQHVLPGTLTSQPPVASFQRFQPEDSTCIHAPQVYPLLQRLSAPPASQNIPASSQAPSNVQTGWSSFTPQSAVPDLLVSSQHPTRPQPSKDKFEPKSAVWADTLSRGLVNLNISGPKINPLADIGIDFDDINRKEKRIEVSNSHAPAMSTITMGKAMGTGSGLGRAGPGALAPPINPKMGSNMALGIIRGGMGMGAPGMGIGGGTVGMNIGMGGGGGFSMGMCMGGGGDFGMGMEGYGGNMNQPSVGVGIGMGMNMGMNTGMGMLPPSGMPQQGHGMPGAYYPMNTGGDYI